MRQRRQLVTSETAKAAKAQHKKPCDDCPWARHSLNGWLGSLSAEEWIEVAHGEGRAECHAHSGVDCAGLAIYRANVCKRVRDAGALVLPANRSTVFGSADEFVQHHERSLLNGAQRALLLTLCNQWGVRGLRCAEVYSHCTYTDLLDLEDRGLVEKGGRGRNVGIFLTMPPEKLKRRVRLVDPDESRDQRKTKDPRDQGVCANLECRASCGEKDFCYGCGFFVCSDCDAGTLPMGEHDVTEHWEEPLL